MQRMQNSTGCPQSIGAQPIQIRLLARQFSNRMPQLAFGLVLASELSRNARCIPSREFRFVAQSAAQIFNFICSSRSAAAADFLDFGWFFFFCSRFFV